MDFNKLAQGSASLYLDGTVIHQAEAQFNEGNDSPSNFFFTIKPHKNAKILEKSEVIQGADNSDVLILELSTRQSQIVQYKIDRNKPDTFDFSLIDAQNDVQQSIGQPFIEEAEHNLSDMQVHFWDTVLCLAMHNRRAKNLPRNNDVAFDKRIQLSPKP